jgi:hypothetical protein
LGIRHGTRAGGNVLIAQMWRRWMIYVGLIVTALPALLGALLIFNCVNPMTLAFITQFDVVNQSGEAVRVTPVGRTESGRVAVLPQYASRLPALAAVRDTDHPIAAGGRRTVRYDWDDIQFTEIRVRGSDGVERVLLTDPGPTTRGYYANRQPQYVIPPLNTLPAARTSFDASRASRVVWLHVIGIGGLVAFAGLFRQLLRKRPPMPVVTQLA